MTVHTGQLAAIKIKSGANILTAVTLKASEWTLDLDKESKDYNVLGKSDPFAVKGTSKNTGSLKVTRDASDLTGQNRIIKDFSESDEDILYKAIFILDDSDPAKPIGYSLNIQVTKVGGEGAKKGEISTLDITLKCTDVKLIDDGTLELV